MKKNGKGNRVMKKLSVGDAEGAHEDGGLEGVSMTKTGIVSRKKGSTEWKVNPAGNFHEGKYTYGKDQTYG